ncbi:hypothetical protein BDY19DRAFT_960361 [Irpex rosettiformis]|uniref:Uncharacterized protein n=1 Tax=Irpex rosettiformis TaxID=378272 RepID=A0ACB8TWU4_9APHY|nr:hypothetical protein BDY19DRAFT_960361 [Irpex rosettiformis]
MSSKPALEEELNGPNDGPTKDIQDPVVWMSDGNIIVGVLDETNNERHMFKCHRGILSSRLPALRDMFEADGVGGSAGASASEKYQGLPFVRFYDNPKHVRLLLRVIYNPSTLPYKWWLRTTMDEIEGLMRLTRKYEAEDLYQHCVTIFQNAWPSTLDRWDLRETEMLRIFDEPQYDEEDYDVWKGRAQVIGHHQPDPGAAILLLDEYDLPGNGASAFYALHTTYVPTYTVSSASPQQLFPNSLPCTANKLSARLLLQFIHGREFIRHLGSELICRTLPGLLLNLRTCDTFDECQLSIVGMWQQRVVSLTEEGSAVFDDPLRTLKNMCGFIEKRGSNDTCVMCKNNMVECLTEARRYIWDGMTIYFGIEDNGNGRERSLYELSYNLRTRMKARGLIL